MRIVSSLPGFFVVSTLLFSPVYGTEKVSWLPLTKHDWELLPDSAKGSRDAVMMFEHIVSDDRKLNDDECYLRVYRRIKIFNAQGRKWADVSLPFDPRKSKIMLVAGRTYLSDGTVSELSETQILVREEIKTEDASMMCTFFSLPGVVDGCIVDYVYEYRNKASNPIWITQKDIPLMEGEYHWKFFPGDLWTRDMIVRMLQNVGIAPNYMALNNLQKIDPTMVPATGKPEEAVFHVNDVSAFQPEPFSLPDEAVRAQIRFYYGSSGDQTDYWSIMSHRMFSWIRSFVSSRDKVKEVVSKEYPGLPTTDAKIKFAYRWVQEHIRNSSFLETASEKNKNVNVDDVMDHREGTREEITILFYSILHELGIPAGMVAGINREQHIFFDAAKYWQFDDPLVFVNDSLYHSHFYSPGDPFLLPGEIPWQLEDTKALVIGAPLGTNLFAEFAKSPPKQNIDEQDISLELEPGQETKGLVHACYTGHQAHRLKALILREPGADKAQVIKEELLRTISNDWKDSLKVLGISERSDSLLVDYRLHGPPLEPDASGRFIFQPLSMFARIEDPFTAATRNDPMMFQYATSITRNFTLSTGKGMKAEILPDPVRFFNRIGDVNVTTNQIGDSLRILSNYILAAPIFSENLYDQVKALFHQHEAIDDYAVVFKENSAKGK